MPNKRKKPRISSAFPNSRWMNLAEACLYVRCSHQYLRRLIHGADLKAARCAKGFVLDREDLDNFLLRRKKLFNPYRRGTKPWISAMHERNRRAA